MYIGVIQVDENKTQYFQEHHQTVYYIILNKFLKSNYDALSSVLVRHGVWTSYL